MSEFMPLAAGWLLTYLVHSTLLLALIWALDAAGALRASAWREAAWRAALFGAVVSASAQALPGTTSLGPRYEAPAGAPVVSASSLHEAVRAAPAAPMLPAAVPPRNETKIADWSPLPQEEAPAAQAEIADRSPLPRGEAPLAQPKIADRSLLPHEEAHDEASRAIDWATPLVLLWLAVAMLLLARIGWMAWLARRELAGRTALVAGPLAEELKWLCHVHDLPTPKLTLAPALAGPVSLPNGEICVPTWAVERLEVRQQRALLAHELAHHRRGDPAWLLGALVLDALLWLQPMNRVARARLAHLAELACDDWSARVVGDGRALAECLAECAARLQPAYAPRFGAAMAEPRSPLVERVERLIQGIAMHTHTLTWPARIAALVLVVGGALLLPTVAVQAKPAPEPVTPPPPAAAPAPVAEPATAPAATPAPAPREARAPRARQSPTTPTVATTPTVPTAPTTPAMAPRAPTPKARSSSHSQSSLFSGRSVSHVNGDTKIRVRDSGYELDVEMEGGVEFTPAEDDVAALDRGGEFSLEETRDGVTRAYHVERGPGTTLKRRYEVDGDERPLDAAGRAWLAKAIPGLLREAAIDVEGRTARLMQQGGAARVFAEIALIEGDYARAEYLVHLIGRYPLAAADLDRAVELARAIDGDYELARVLKAAVARGPAAGPLARLYAIALDIDSDYELAEVLIAGAPALPADAESRRAWLGAAAQVGSDYELRRALSELAARRDLDAALVGDALALAGRELDSDYELRETLTVFAAHATTSALAKAYAQAAARAGSDYECREALTALLRRAKLDRDGYAAVLDAAGSIDSDYERREVLVETAKGMPNDPALVASYRALTAGMGDYEAGVASRALLDRITQ